MTPAPVDALLSVTGPAPAPKSPDAAHHRDEADEADFGSALTLATAASTVVQPPAAQPHPRLDRQQPARSVMAAGAAQTAGGSYATEATGGGSRAATAAQGKPVPGDQVSAGASQDPSLGTDEPVTATAAAASAPATGQGATDPSARAVPSGTPASGAADRSSPTPLAPAGNPGPVLPAAAAVAGQSGDRPAGPGAASPDPRVAPGPISAGKDNAVAPAAPPPGADPGSHTRPDGGGKADGQPAPAGAPGAAAGAAAGAVSTATPASTAPTTGSGPARPAAPHIASAAGVGAHPAPAPRSGAAGDGPATPPVVTSALTMAPAAVTALQTPAPPPVGVAGGAGPAGSDPAAAPAPPAAQLVTVLSPLRGADGTHRVSLRLQPEGLGMVEATVTVRAGHVVVELTADNTTGRQALAAALPDLRQQLTEGGQQATVFMSGGGADGRGQQFASGFGAPGSGSASEPDDADALTASAPAPARAGAGIASSVDIRL